jgi:transketolase
LVPYGGTFLIFSDYMRPTIRLAAMSRLRVIYVFTHDSIGLGEDGPTHQPIEHLASLRAIPNLLVLRPGDANETAHAWWMAINRRNGPTALALTRQNLPVWDRREFASAAGLRRGAYVLADRRPDGREGPPELILMASGSEVSIAVGAGEILRKEGVSVRLVSFPSWELFAEQSEAYRSQVLPPSVRARVAVEAARPLGWERWVGEAGVAIGLDRFGASAPYKDIYRAVGLTEERVAEAARGVLQRTLRERMAP